MSSFRTYRVRFCEWQAYAINISARSPDDAIQLAMVIRGDHGTEPFEQLEDLCGNWEAEEVQS